VIPGAVARALERGRLASWPTRRLADVWARHARPVRPLPLPEGAHVIGVGGATLGGSYKTPLVLALARALSAEAARVAVVAHGYGARVREARAVSPDDDARAVGDDAAWLARALRPDGVAVFVGPRARAVALAAFAGPVLVVDGLLQASPRRLGLALLAVDAAAPWGAGACPPAGDLRAPEHVLLGAADAIVAVVSSSAVRTEELGRAAHAARRPLFVVTSALRATEARSGGEVDLDALSRQRVGVVTAIARPDRFVRSLTALGLRPAAIRHFADHAWPPPTPSRRAPPVDVWLTTPKCATKLSPRYDGAPVVVVDQRLAIPPDLVRACLPEIFQGIWDSRVPLSSAFRVSDPW